MKRSVTLCTALLCLLALLPLGAEEKEKKQKKSKLDLTQRYLLLATEKTSTMQKELNEAAAAGYRIAVGSPTSGTEMALFLEKVAEPPNTYEYNLLATSQTTTMQKELNQAAAKGFRLLPRTMIAKTSPFGLYGGGVEIVVVLEKAPASEVRYQYLLLATTLTSTLQKEVSEALQNGYELVGMVSRGEHMVIMEKTVVPPVM